MQTDHPTKMTERNALTTSQVLLQLEAEANRLFAARPHGPQRFCCCQSKSSTSSTHPRSY